MTATLPEAPATVTVPASLAGLVIDERRELPRWAQEAIVLEAWRVGNLFTSEAARMLDLSYHEYLTLAADRRVSQWTEEMVQEDLEFARRHIASRNDGG